MKQDEDIEGTVTDEFEDLSLMNIRLVQSKAGIMLDLTVEAQPLQMELDTGASVSIISEKAWKQIVGAIELTVS